MDFGKLNKKLYLGLVIVAIMILAAVALNPVDAANAANATNATNATNNSSNSSQNFTLILSDVHIDSDGWCFLWGKLSSIPSDIEDYTFEVEYYDDSGDVIKSVDEKINLTAKVGDEYLIGGADVNNETSKVKVTVFDADNHKIATATSEHITRV